MDFQTLHRFIKNNDVQLFKRISGDSKIFSLQSKCGDSVLHIASRYDRDEILDILVTNHADIEVSNHEGKKPLHEAAQCSSQKCLHSLLKKGALIDTLKRADWTPLMLACTKSCLDVVQALLDSGANPCLKNKDGWNAFHIACREGHLPIIEALVKNCPLVWDTTSNNLRTPLHTAALQGKSEAVSWLLKNCKYNIDAVDSCGITAFNDSLRSGHVEIALLLFSKYQANGFVHDKMGRQAIHHVSQTGQLSALDFILSVVKTPVDTVSMPSQETALHVAAKEGHKSIMEMLLSHGAEINRTDSHGRTALHIASGAQSASCVQYLLYHGALILPDNNGKLPNQYAIKKTVLDIYVSVVQ